MFCFIACFVGGNPMPHKKLSECSRSHSYSPNQLIKIDGKIWTFIRYLSNGKCLMYSYEKCAGKFITRFGLFHLNVMGDFIQFPFADGVDKIETAHDHAPKICENRVEVRLTNERRIDVCVRDEFVLQAGKYKHLGQSLYYDNHCSINQIK